MRRTCALLVVIAVLLAGCRSGCEEEKNSRPEESSLGRVIDSPAGLPMAPSQRGKDSLKEYYERMERWRVLHGGMSKWESDK